MTHLQEDLPSPSPAALLAQVAPQRSTQYAALAATLAPAELQASPLPIPGPITPLELGGQPYLKIPLHPPSSGEANAGIDMFELGMLAFTGPFFQYFDIIPPIPGPLLRPLNLHFTPALPPELVQARRYRGKTNEQFTHFLCNMARFAGAFRTTPWSQLRVLDPLAGGGTTVFTALMLGASAAGIEQDAQDTKSTVAFLRQFMTEQRLPARVQEEQLRKFPGGRGQRWTFTFGRERDKTPPQTCIFALGDTRQAAHLLPGFRPHFIVTDLPYGIQHQGPLNDLLTAALPVWEKLLLSGGTLAFAWDATRFPRAQMQDLVHSHTTLKVCDQPPFSELAHPVDRVIRQRDVLVATKP